MGELEHQRPVVLKCLTEVDLSLNVIGEVLLDLDVVAEAVRLTFDFVFDLKTLVSVVARRFDNIDTQVFSKVVLVLNRQSEIVLRVGLESTRHVYFTLYDHRLSSDQVQNLAYALVSRIELLIVIAERFRINR